MKVLLIENDNLLPNLAYMKLSAYHKSLGNQIGFNIDDPDIVYLSKTFLGNDDWIKSLKEKYEDKLIIGGSGYDLQTKLPAEIEYLKPDYSLYDNLICRKCGKILKHCHCRIMNSWPGKMFYNMGFTTRGCIRSCYFCIVHDKEGSYHINQHPKEWCDFKYTTLLDNNWYANKEWFFETSQWFIDQKHKIDPCQGMDIRIIDDEIAAQLKKLKFFKPIHFAYDDEKYRNKVLDGLEILKNNNINMRGNYFYVYCHDDAHFESALARANELKNHNCGAFVMNNKTTEMTQRRIDLARWANRPQLFWSISFKEYNNKYKSKK